MKSFLIILASIIIFTHQAISLPWWEQITICRIDTTKCYTTMGNGFDTEMWDTYSKCRGMKYICPDALVENTAVPLLVSKKDMNNKNIIKTDYDTELLSENGDCFGRRKTNKSGNEVMVKGDYVKVWCEGVLDYSDETLPNGDILHGTQPTCETLKKNSYAAVENGKCFGKYYDNSTYYIDCVNNKLQPERIIILNGATYSKNTHLGPTTTTDAERMFDKMESISQAQKSQYFKK